MKINTEQKKVVIKRVEVASLRKKLDWRATLGVNGETYSKFRKIMEEQGLGVSKVINEFMSLTNDLLTKNDGGEIKFIFKPIKSKKIDRK